MKRRAFLPLLTGAVLAPALQPLPAAAQPAASSAASGSDLAGQVVRIVVGFPPGGTADAVARLFAQELQKQLGGTFIVDNRAGAGGQIAAEYFRALPADGRTLLLGNSHMFSTLPLTSRHVKYDPLKDFVPVARLATFESSYAVSAAQPARSLAEFIALARSKPALRSFGIPAAGSGPHFIGYLVARNAGFDMVPIPYKGGAPLLTDLLGNSIPAAVDALGSHLEAHRAGKIRVLAVTGAARSPLLPDVPTFAELGYPPALNASGWLGLFAPVGTASAQAERIAASVAEIAALPAVRGMLANIGFTAAAGNPQQLQQTVRTELDLWRPVIRESGFQVD